MDETADYDELNGLLGYKMLSWMTPKAQFDWNNWHGGTLVVLMVPIGFHYPASKQAHNKSNSEVLKDSNYVVIHCMNRHKVMSLHDHQKLPSIIPIGNTTTKQSPRIPNKSIKTSPK